MFSSIALSTSSNSEIKLSADSAAVLFVKAKASSSALFTTAFPSTTVTAFGTFNSKILLTIPALSAL